MFSTSLHLGCCFWKYIKSRQQALDNSQCRLKFNFGRWLDFMCRIVSHESLQMQEICLVIGQCALLYKLVDFRLEVSAVTFIIFADSFHNRAQAHGSKYWGLVANCSQHLFVYAENFCGKVVIIVYWLASLAAWVQLCCGN